MTLRDTVTAADIERLRAQEDYVYIRFDGPLGPVCGRFIATEDDTGSSVGVGEWVDNSDGTWSLRVPVAKRHIRRTTDDR